MRAPCALPAQARRVPFERPRSSSNVGRRDMLAGAAAIPARGFRARCTGGRSISSITRPSSSRTGQGARSLTSRPTPTCRSSAIGCCSICAPSGPSGGRTHPAGALLIIACSGFLAGARDFTTLFEPSPRRFLQSFSTAGDVVAIAVLDDVRSRISLARFAEGGWKIEPVTGFPDLATLSIFPLAQDDDDWFAESERERGVFVIASQNSLTPPTQSLVTFGQAPELLKQSPRRFDADGLEITQHEAVSVDGTRIPYFQIGRGGTARRRRQCGAADRLRRLSRFRACPITARSPASCWLERGGVYVLANIRGGGEFGPDWHKAGMREGNDSARTTISTRSPPTSSRAASPAAASRLPWAAATAACWSATCSRAIRSCSARSICAVPLLDMRRYTKLSAGSSWIGGIRRSRQSRRLGLPREISRPIRQSQAGTAYPPILLTTSTRDDRVHPGHARKMAAKLMALGYPRLFLRTARRRPRRRDRQRARRLQHRARLRVPAQDHRA